MTTTRRVLGVAIVGCGQIATHHVEAMSKVGTQAVVLEVRALCDPSVARRTFMKRLVEELSTSLSSSDSAEDDASRSTRSCTNGSVIQEFNTLDDLLSWQTEQNEAKQQPIDIIFIAVPHDLHEALAMQALEDGGQHSSSSPCLVVLEKPLAVTSDSCDRLVRVSSASTTIGTGSNRFLFIAEQSPYWPAVMAAREAVEQGHIGVLVTAAAYYYESMRDNITSGSVGGGLGWRGSLARAGGGIGMDGGLHWLRPLRECCGGRVRRVVGIVRPNLAPALQMEGEVLGHALLEMEQGSDEKVDFLYQPANAGPLVATYSCNMLATAPMAHDVCPYFRFTGTGGELVVSGTGLQKDIPGAGGLRLYNEEHPSGVELLPTDQRGGFFLGFIGLWKEIIRIFLEKDRASAHESVVRAADDVKVVLALYKSAKSGQWECTN
jgi:UDP-N-acetyl-2-amino-2-deoxyglucuronate dehydrogenase